MHLAARECLPLGCIAHEADPQAVGQSGWRNFKIKKQIPCLILVVGGNMHASLVYTSDDRWADAVKYQFRNS